VAALHNRIYQTSDLAGAERKTFIDAARRGRAYLRAPDGESLVMLRESVLETTSTIAEIALEYLNVLRVLNKPREERAPSDYGRWLSLKPLMTTTSMSFFWKCTRQLFGVPRWPA
jgi:hypothetical protein